MLEKIKQVEQIFKRLEKKVVTLQKGTGLTCQTGCNLCCLKPDLEANVLEFLPLAYYLVQTNQYEAALEKIESGQTLCINLKTLRLSEIENGCSNYAYRGLICRLFGSSAIKDKNNQLQPYLCKIQKEVYAEKLSGITAEINRKQIAPVVSDYYYELQAIDPYLANDYNPINQSILKAISLVAYWYSNRPKRKRSIPQAG